MGWLKQNGYENLRRHEQAILSIASSRALWKRTVSDILRWRSGQQGSLQVLTGCEMGVARHLRVTDKLVEFCQLSPGGQSTIGCNRPYRRPLQENVY